MAEPSPQRSRPAEPDIPEEEGPPEWAGPGRHEFQTAGVTDSATPRDTLGFGPYVRAMATFLTNPRTNGPLTISVEGEWGSGKSSFMLQLKNTLGPAADEWNKKVSEPVRAPIVVWFNAWRNDKAEELWAAFAQAILRELSSKLTFRGRWKAHARLLKLRFDWRQGGWDFIRFLAPTLALVTVAILVPAYVGVDKLLEGLAAKEPGPAIVASLKDHAGSLVAYFVGCFLLWVLWIKNSIGNPFSVDLSKHVRSPDYNSKVSFIEQFHQDFSNILDVYVPKGHKVVCFIDDLDRCDTPKAADLMQAINLMLLTDERMIFLLGMDRQKVAAGLAVKFKDLIPFLPEPGLHPGAAASEKAGSAPSRGLWFGHDFIEKFVQIAYSLPRPAPDNLDGFFKELVGSSAPPRDTAQKKSGRWKNTFARLRPRFRRASGGAIPSQQSRTSAQTDQAVGPHAAPGGDGTAAGEETPREKRRELVRLVELVESESDPAVLKQLVDVLAPAFDYNPRRLKQFVNLFRLNLATAAATRLLYVEEGSEASGIRLEQLGKFVALGIRWPDLIPWLERDPRNRLKDLCEKAYAKGDWDPPIQVSRPDRLRQLLKAGCFDRNNIKLEDAARWSLENVDVQMLLAVSPAAPPTPQAAPSVGADAVEAPVPTGRPGTNSGDETEYVLIPPGRFKMGAVPGDEQAQDYERPQHEVAITKPFYLKRTPVTVGEYKRFAREAGREMPAAPEFNNGWEKENHPIVNVSWEDARAYCEWAGGRLPTEAEWEYAARGGKENLRYPNGNELTEQDAHFGASRTAPVGQYPPNGYGLRDMAGTAWEWVADWYREDYYQNSPSTDPKGPDSGEFRVLRGGSWGVDPEYLRVSGRMWVEPEVRYNIFGFRYAREVVS